VTEQEYIDHLVSIAPPLDQATRDTLAALLYMPDVSRDSRATDRAA
jgi:hypothetical protein